MWNIYVVKRGTVYNKRKGKIAWFQYSINNVDLICVIIKDKSKTVEWEVQIIINN